LICTSAGEVGVNISADHMVGDLTPFESMTQRLGRVNRFGFGEACIDIVHLAGFDTKEKPLEVARERTLALLKKLPRLEDGRFHASPQALGDLPLAERLAAFSPPPTILPVSDILFDAWALTTIRGAIPGRPPVEPYLHGINEWEPPQTEVAWREEVWELRPQFKDEEDRKQEEPKQRKRLAKLAAELLEDFPIKSHEVLRERSDRVFTAMKKLAAPPETPAWLMDEKDAVFVSTLGELLAGEKEILDNKTLLLPPQAGGLENGLLVATAKHDPSRTNFYDVADEWYDAGGRQLRQREWDAPKPPGGMKLERIIPIRDSDDEEAEPTKTWYWFVRPAAEDSPNARSRREYDLQAHLDDAKAAAERFLETLRLDAELRRAVILAAWFHDLGKDRKHWQRGIGNIDYPVRKWAKSGNLMAAIERSTYRHEFGSLLDVQGQAEFISLKPDLQQLVLQLIGAHHGRARPHFPGDEAFDHEAKGWEVAGIAASVPGRYAHLQRKYGRWGLAYLESLVRAADALASRKAEGGDV